MKRRNTVALSAGNLSIQAAAQPGAPAPGSPEGARSAQRPQSRGSIMGQSRSSADLQNAGKASLAPKLERRNSMSLLSDENMKERLQKQKDLMDAMECEDKQLLLHAIAEAKSARVDLIHINSAIEILQRFQARESLDDAMKGEDAEVLRRAIANAKQCGGLDDVATKQEQNKLERLDAEQGLARAVAFPETGSLRIAINRARFFNVEVDNENLIQAEKCLAQLESIKALESAIKMRDVSKLQAAVDKAESAGIDGSLQQMAYAKAILAEEEARNTSDETVERGWSKSDEVLDQLVRAIRMQETGGLRDAIRHAGLYGFELPELEEAKLCLGRLEAQRKLQTALKTKRPEHAKLKSALAECKEFGVEDDAVAQASFLVEQLEARDSLSAAITSKDAEKLPEAIKHAQAFGVDRTKIIKAEELLHKLTASANGEASTLAMSAVRSVPSSRSSVVFEAQSSTPTHARRSMQRTRTTRF